MADLNIPNLNKKSDKYLFKNKLNQRRKSSKTLIKEIFLMLSVSILIVYLNSLIPKKSLLFGNFFVNLEKIFIILFDFFSYFFQIILVLIILMTFLFSIILFLGSIYRIFKLFKRKTKKFPYK